MSNYKRSSIITIIAGIACGILASISYLYFQYIVVAGGIYADEHGTSGLITHKEISLAFLALALMVSSLALLTRARKDSVKAGKPLTIFQICIVCLTVIGAIILSSVQQ